MRILLTGVNGLVGKALAIHLLDLGHEVVGLGRAAATKLSLSYVVVDLSSPAALTILEQLEPCQAIVHAAADLNLTAFSPAVTAVNCFGTHQLIHLAKLWQVQSFIYLSSIGVLGQPERTPLTEQQPVQPLTIYHASKAYSEQIIALAAPTFFTYHILRLSAPIGPSMSLERILPVFIRRAQANLPLLLYGQGTRQQNYVDVRDVALATEQALTIPDSSLCHIAGATAISNRELAKLCIRLTRSDSVIQHVPSRTAGDDEVWNISLDKARQVLGYVPQYTVAQSIRHILEGTTC